MAAFDVEFTGESGTVYVLNFGTNAMCRLEAATGKTYGEVLTQLRVEFPSIALTRTFVRCAVISEQVESEERAGEIADDIGGIPVVLAALSGID